MSQLYTFDKIELVATHLRDKLCYKKYILLFGHNTTGKTRISMAFKDKGIVECKKRKQDIERDTLYYNAFTEDLFSWDNDLVKDEDRVLKINSQSRFFDGFVDAGMEERIRKILVNYSDFDFKIDFENSLIRFSSKIQHENGIEDSVSKHDVPNNIKISRGEENIFIWCVFLAIVMLVVDEDNESYKWVKYIFIDDPISSLDENNVVIVAHNLLQIIKQDNSVKFVVSSHHALFFNVLCNQLSNSLKYFLSKSKFTEKYTLKDIKDTPNFYHVSMLSLLHQASQTGEIYPYHFTILRSILEKTAGFFGHKHFSDCIHPNELYPDEKSQSRAINIMSHGNISLYESTEMSQDDKALFINILNEFIENYKFNSELFSELAVTQEGT